MAKLEGKIEKIVSKPMPADKYDNVFRLSVKIGDKWVGLGGVKKEGLSIQKGKEWIELSVGDEVVIVAEENGDFLNAKRSDVKLLKKGSSAAPAAVPGSPLPPKGKQPSSTYFGTDRDAEIKAGMFFNKAVDVAIAKHGEKLQKGDVVKAYQMLAQAYDECRSAKLVPEPRDVAPDKDSEHALEAYGSDFDDDIPF